MNPLLIAHRGASHQAPENTLAAFRLAWKEGADGMECDVRLTRDGEVVCIHDASTLRTTGVDLRVADSDWAELKELDAGGWKHPDYAGEPLPLLKDVLAELPAGKQIFIEIKCGQEIIPTLSEVLRSSTVVCEQVAIIAFDAKVIKQARKQLPHIKAHWITKFKRGLGGLHWKPSIRSILHTLKTLEASGLDCQAHESIDQTWVNELKEAGHHWHVWTIDDPALARRFAALEVESITTNTPGALREALEGQAPA